VLAVLQFFAGGACQNYFAFIVYYVMRSKNEVLCAAAGRLAAERSEADKPAKAHNSYLCNGTN
jgi:hypothetical protein